MEDQAEKQQLIQYLLGGLQVEERRQIEERYFDNDAFFQEMLIIEEELIDSYVNNGLSPEEAERFEKHYLTTPERRAQVEFAKVLAASLPNVIRMRALEKAQAAPLARASLFAALLARYRSLSWRFALPLAVVVLLGGLGLWLYGQSSRLRQERAWLSQQRRETDSLNEQLERNLRRLEQDTKRIESLTTASPEDSRIAIGALFSMLTRSGQQGQVLRISLKATLLLLQAPVDSTENKTYRAVLTQDGAEILQLNNVSPRSTSNGSLIEIPMTTAMLNGRSYTLTVKQEDGDEGTDTYSFQIQKTQP